MSNEEKRPIEDSVETVETRGANEADQFNDKYKVDREIEKGNSNLNSNGRLAGLMGISNLAVGIGTLVIAFASIYTACSINKQTQLLGEQTSALVAQTGTVVKQTEAVTKQADLLDVQTTTLQKQLSLQLSTMVPAVELEPSKSKDYSLWGYSPMNRSSHPAVIIAKNIRIHAGEYINQDTKPIHLFVTQGKDSLLLNITKLSPTLAERIRTGKENLRIEGCVIFKSTNEDDTRRWKAVSKDTYDFRVDQFSVDFRYFKRIPDRTKDCKVDSPF